MPSINDYARNPQQALIDAAASPEFREFIEPADLELVTVDLRDGTQAQVQALAGRSIGEVIKRIIAKGHKARVDLDDWICSPKEFDLCSKLDTPPGELMRQLDKFLNKKAAQGGAAVLGLVAIFVNPVLGGSLAIFSALGFINNYFVELCDCDTHK